MERRTPWLRPLCRPWREGKGKREKGEGKTLGGGKFPLFKTLRVTKAEKAARRARIATRIQKNMEGGRKGGKGRVFGGVVAVVNVLVCCGCEGERKNEMK